MKISSWLLCFLGTILLTAPVRAQLIDVHFTIDSLGATNGGPPFGPAMTGSAVLGAAGDTWNNIGAYFGTGIPLVYANGSSSPVTITFAAQGGYNVHAFGGSTPFAGTPYDPLMENYLYTKAASQTITLANLAPFSTYNLVLYAAEDVPGTGRKTSFTVTTNTLSSTWNGTSSNLVVGIDYVEFPAAATDGSGNMVITWGPGIGSSEGDINGFQLQPFSRATLAISVAAPSAGAITLSWPTNIPTHLQVQSNSLNGGWTDLPGATSPYVVTPGTAQNAFYRLKSP